MAEDDRTEGTARWLHALVIMGAAIGTGAACQPPTEPAPPAAAEPPSSPTPKAPPAPPPPPPVADAPEPPGPELTPDPEAGPEPELWPDEEEARPVRKNEKRRRPEMLIL